MNGACVMRSTKRMPHWVRRNESYVNSDTQCSSDNTFCHRRISRYLEQFPTFLHYGV